MSNSVPELEMWAKVSTQHALVRYDAEMRFFFNPQRL